MKRIFILLTLFFLLSSCIEHPEISVNDIRLDGIVQGDLKIKIMVDIHNPNNFDITIKQVEYKLYYNEMKVGNGSWEGNEVLEANSTKTLPFFLSIDKDIFMKLFAAFLKGSGNELQSKVRVEIKATLKKFGKTFVYNYSWNFKGKINDKRKNDKDTKYKTDGNKDELGTDDNSMSIQK